MTIGEFVGTLFDEDYAEFLVLKLRRQDQLVGIKFELRSNNGRNCLAIIESEEDYTCGHFYKDFGVVESWDCVYFNNELIDEKEVYLEFNYGDLEIKWL